MKRKHYDLLLRIAPWAGLGFLLLFCVGLLFLLGMPEELVLGVGFILIVFCVFVMAFFLWRKRQIDLHLKRIYGRFTFSNYDSSKDLLTQLDRLDRRLAHYIERREGVETVLRDRETFRKEFVGNLSHELKTPLFTLQGYIYTLIESGYDDHSMLDQYLKRAAIGSDRLVSVVKDLDMITKLENDSSALECENFDIVDLCAEVISMLDLKARKRGIKVAFDRSYPEPVYVRADELRIEQVLINLISNAIKYSDSDTTILVKIFTAADKIIVEVSDRGIGIETKHLPRIFERFYRVDKGRSREDGGSGLGLAIVKHIVESHGERIQVESRYGEGSKFYFSLPKAKV